MKNWRTTTLLTARTALRPVGGEIVPSLTTANRKDYAMRMVLILIAALVITPAYAATSYPFHVTTGYVCDTADNLKVALDDHRAGIQVPPDMNCMILAESLDVVATATPVQEYHNGDSTGFITRFDAPGFPPFYGLMHSDHAYSDVST